MRARVAVLFVACLPGWVLASNADIVNAARAQVGVTMYYDPAYRTANPDRNIDHRRVPNLMTYFGRRGFTQPVTQAATTYLPGDVVAWDLGRGILHIGIVSDRASVTGVPLIVHNIGSGAREEDILFRFTIIGHYRLPPPVP